MCGRTMPIWTRQAREETLPLARMPEALKARRVRSMLEQAGVPMGEITRRHIRAVCTLADKRSGTVSLPGQFRTVNRQGTLSVVPETPKTAPVHIKPNQAMAFGAYTVSIVRKISDIHSSFKYYPIAYDTINMSNLTVRTWQSSDRMQLPGRAGRAPSSACMRNAALRRMNETVCRFCAAATALSRRRESEQMSGSAVRADFLPFVKDKKQQNKKEITSMKQDIEKVLLSEETIAAKVKELGAQIAKDYADKNPLIVSVLRGSFVFMADLVRAIDVPCTVDFMSVSSYGGGTTSSGEVKITKDFDVSIEGRHLIIVEDILDSGRTLSYLMKTLKARGAASIALCTFLDKPERRVVPVEVAYKGFTVPDAFIVGYGLDYDQKYRNLPYVGVLKSSVYEGK